MVNILPRLNTTVILVFLVTTVVRYSTSIDPYSPVWQTVAFWCVLVTIGFWLLTLGYLARIVYQSKFRWSIDAMLLGVETFFIASFLVKGCQFLYP